MLYVGIVGNTRVISQSSLQTFQEEMGKVVKDPYKVNIDSRDAYKNVAKGGAKWDFPKV